MDYQVNLMLQHPDPIEPNTPGKLVFSVNGEKYPFDEDTIPGLFVAYVAAQRAKYYAGVDAFRCDGNASARETFDQSFKEEVNHALRDRLEIRDWMDNNMDAEKSDVSAISVTYIHPDK